MTFEALKTLHDAGINGLKIDAKGDHETYMRYCGGADVEKVWRNAAEAKRLGLHVEIVNLVISGVNDGENALRWVVEKSFKNTRDQKHRCILQSISLDHAEQRYFQR